MFIRALLSKTITPLKGFICQFILVIGFPQLISSEEQGSFQHKGMEYLPESGDALQQFPFIKKYRLKLKTVLRLLRVLHIVLFGSCILLILGTHCMFLLYSSSIELLSKMLLSRIYRRTTMENFCLDLKTEKNVIAGWSTG